LKSHGYRERAEETFQRYLLKCQQVAERHGIPSATFVLRKMNTRWGSCSSKGGITLNLHLIQTPVHCIEYVIMHELCHLKHHSRLPQEHVALCAEFPSLSWLSSTPESALKGIRKTVAEVIEDMQECGEMVPEPLATRKFSGKFQVRISPEIHRNLAMEAAEEHISLNRLISAKLAHA